MKTQLLHIRVTICFLLILFLPSISSAVKYKVINEALNFPGGLRFKSEIGTRYTLQIMQTINFFIWDVFQQYSYADRKPVENVTIFIRQYDRAEAITLGEEIHVSAMYLEGYKGDLRWEFTSLIHHELTHVFQWDGAVSKAPTGLVEGVADYMMLKSSYYPPGYAKRGQGDSWDQGYDFTARFLEYCDEVKPGFVAELNKMMRYHYNETFFKELTGRTVHQLWDDYKAKYPYHDG